jgi:transposase
MIVVPTGVRVLIATQPVDFRKGMDGLGALARERLGQDPFSGIVLVFRAKRADRIKLLFWDGRGLLLVSKRLEQGGSVGGATAPKRIGPVQRYSGIAIA